MVFTAGYMIYRSLQAAALGKNGVICRAVSIRSLKPLNEAGIAAFVKGS